MRQNRGRLISRWTPKEIPSSHGMLMRSTPTILRKPQGLEGFPLEGGRGGVGRPRRPTSGPASCARTYRCAITTVLVASLDYPQPPTTGGWMGLPLSKGVFPVLMETFASSFAYLFRVASWLLLSRQGQGMDSNSLADRISSCFLRYSRGDRNCLIFGRIFRLKDVPPRFQLLIRGYNWRSTKQWKEGPRWRKYPRENIWT